MKADWKETIPPDHGDCRKLVTLEKDGMIWVGVRVWSGARWLNSGIPEPANVLAWDDLPAPAYSDGLMSGMQPPTL